MEIDIKTVIGLLIFCAIFLAGVGVVAYAQDRRKGLMRILGQNKTEEKTKKKFIVPYNLRKIVIQAGINANQLEINALFILAILSGFGFGMLLFGKVGIAVLLSPLGAGIPILYLKARINKRTSVLRSQFEQLLRYIANSLQAGASLQQAVFSAERKVPEPLATEIRNICKEVNAGSSLIYALENAAERIPLSEFRMVLLAIKIHTNVGGDLARVLLNAADTIRERQSLYETMKAHVSEGRFAANMVGLMPIVAVSLIKLSTPEYFDPMTKTLSGQIILAGCVISVFMGWMMVRKMSDFKL